MGGEQAASVLAQVGKDSAEARGKPWSSEEEESFKEKIRRKYEKESSCYYSSARLWDDGVILPQDSRKVLGLSLSATMSSLVPPATPHKFGVFRM
eukprot:GILI01003922.1.p1 GENE.GILI01003922.1~~GILI01003922.1.p1  ORF type:complete len:111 (+),score=40.73 GILI01003922.1:49-333(+)